MFYNHFDFLSFAAYVSNQKSKIPTQYASWFYPVSDILHRGKTSEPDTITDLGDPDEISAVDCKYPQLLFWSKHAETTVPHDAKPITHLFHEIAFLMHVWKAHYFF